LSLGPCTRKAALIVALVACHQERASYVVDVVLPGFDAETKLRPGDRIVEIDGKPLQPPAVSAPLRTEVNLRNGAAVTLVVERDGHEHTIVVRPQQDRTNDGQTSWVLGIRPR